MRRELLVRRATRLVLLAASVAAISGSVMAQQNPLPEIRIQAAGVVKKQKGKTSSGVPIETAEITMRVSYADLPLDTNSGQALLRARVTDAAKDACRRASATYPRSVLEKTDEDCVKTAVDAAKPQVDAAIAAANAPK